MIRRAEEKDRAAVLDWLRAEPEFNLFAIGDILAYGMQSEEIEIFLETRRGAIDALLLRLRTSFVIAERDGADLAALAGRVNTALATPGTWHLSGKKAVVERLMARVPFTPTEAHDCIFCVCREPKAEVRLDRLDAVRLATAAETPEVTALQELVFGDRRNAENMAKGIERGDRVAIVRDGATGRIICAAGAVAESDASAMIVGVATHPEHRGKGCASACVWRLISDLRARGKSACLFFHNPDAGSIYRRLGFADIGVWRLLEFPR